MTLHIEIDKNTEKQLAAIANLEKISVEELAISCLRERAKAQEKYNAKLRAKLKAAENSPLVENFSIDGFLQEMKKKHSVNENL